jgi:hypothetical protein
MSNPKKPYDRTVHRLREIERIVKHRHGVLPDTDDVDIVLNQVACCQLQMRRKKLGQLPEFDDLVDRLSLWCERWAPEASILKCRDAAREEGDVVFAIWQDPEEEYGVDYLIVKGAKRLKEIVASQTGQPMRLSAVKCICAEQAIALQQALGDRDHDA